MLRPSLAPLRPRRARATLKESASQQKACTRLESTYLSRMKMRSNKRTKSEVIVVLRSEASAARLKSFVKITSQRMTSLMKGTLREKFGPMMRASTSRQRAQAQR